MRSEEWKSLLDEEPDNELLRFSYAKALMDEKQWVLAVPQFEALVRHDPEYAIAWAFLARCALNSGDKVKASEACKRGLPIAEKQKHEVPKEEIESILDALNSQF